jgi:hypothetical protein
MVLLVTGTLLARGQRTVTAALKILGLDQTHNWPKYHQLLSRARWSPLSASSLLVRLMVTTLVEEGHTLRSKSYRTKRWNGGGDVRLKRKAIGATVWQVAVESTLLAPACGG